MKKPRTYFALGTGLKYSVIILATLFAFIAFSHLADKAIEKNTRFDCWKLEQYASTYEGFWITEDEQLACKVLDININAEVRTK